MLLAATAACANDDNASDTAARTFRNRVNAICGNETEQRVAVDTPTADPTAGQLDPAAFTAVETYLGHLISIGQEFHPQYAAVRAPGALTPSWETFVNADRQALTALGLAAGAAQGRRQSDLLTNLAAVDRARAQAAAAAVALGLRDCAVTPASTTTSAPPAPAPVTGRLLSPEEFRSAAQTACTGAVTAVERLTSPQFDPTRQFTPTQFDAIERYFRKLLPIEQQLATDLAGIVPPMESLHEWTVLRAGLVGTIAAIEGTIDAASRRDDAAIQTTLGTLAAAGDQIATAAGALELPCFAARAGAPEAPVPAP